MKSDKFIYFFFIVQIFVFIIVVVVVVVGAFGEPYYPVTTRDSFQ